MIKTASPSPPLAVLMAHGADAVAAVRAGRSLNDALAATPTAVRPGTQSIAFHALRGLGAAQALRQQLAPKAPPPWVDALLLLALALSRPAGDAPPPYDAHTLVNQAVDAAKRHAAAQARFVNAVLRRYLREREALEAAITADPVAAWNHPRWWIDALQRDWPMQWQELLQANDRRAPMSLRVNARRSEVPAYLVRLAAAGIAARGVSLPGGWGGAAIELALPRAVHELPGFDAGDVSVQDLAAQQAAPLLLGDGLPAGARVLDACAAPGGKTAHLLELADLDLLALDVDAARLQKVDQSLRRLGLHAQLATADARDTAAWWDGRPFDAILLDAPCSASGIVRRHPDVRWLRRPSDIEALARTQAALLDALWPLLAPGGRLVHATCSVFKAEGERGIDAFLQRAPDAELRPSPGQLLPLADNGSKGEAGGQAGVPDAPPPVTDGFHYALLHKRVS